MNKILLISNITTALLILVIPAPLIYILYRSILYENEFSKYLNSIKSFIVRIRSSICLSITIMMIATLLLTGIIYREYIFISNRVKVSREINNYANATNIRPKCTVPVIELTLDPINDGLEQYGRLEDFWIENVPTGLSQPTHQQSAPVFRLWPDEITTKETQSTTYYPKVTVVFNEDWRGQKANLTVYYKWAYPAQHGTTEESIHTTVYPKTEVDKIVKGFYIVKIKEGKMALSVDICTKQELQLLRKYDNRKYINDSNLQKIRDESIAGHVIFSILGLFYGLLASFGCYGVIVNLLYKRSIIEPR